MLTSAAGNRLFSDALDIPLVDQRAVLYLCTGPLTDAEGKTLEIIVNKKQYITQTRHNIAGGRVAPITKPGTKTWSDAVYSGGIGTAEQPYLISNQTNMRALGASVNSHLVYADRHFTVENDFSITTSESDPWDPIGTASSILGANFNGNGKTIDAGTLYIASTTPYLGIFGVMEGSISDLTLKSNIQRIDNDNMLQVVLGSLVGLQRGGIISDCHHIGSLQANGPSSKSDVTYVGGLVGAAQNSQIDKCTQSGGNITTSYIRMIGGLCGMLQSPATLHRSKVSDCTINSGNYAIFATDLRSERSSDEQWAIRRPARHTAMLRATHT